LIFCSTVVACRNPHLAAERARKREDLLTATEALLAKTRDQVTAGRIRGAGKIGVRAGKIINRYKVAKHFILDITDDQLAWRRDQTAVDAPLTYTDDQPRGRGNPIAPARRSARADAEAATHTTPTGTPFAASEASWTTSPPSPAAPSRSAPSPSTNSATPPPPSAAPSTSSGQSR